MSSDQPVVDTSTSIFASSQNLSRKAAITRCRWLRSMGGGIFHILCQFGRAAIDQDGVKPVIDMGQRFGPGIARNRVQHIFPQEGGCLRRTRW